MMVKLKGDECNEAGVGRESTRSQPGSPSTCVQPVCCADTAMHGSCPGPGGLQEGAAGTLWACPEFSLLLVHKSQPVSTAGQRPSLQGMPGGAAGTRCLPRRRGQAAQPQGSPHSTESPRTLGPLFLTGKPCACVRPGLMWLCQPKEKTRAVPGGPHLVLSVRLPGGHVSV